MNCFSRNTLENIFISFLVLTPFFPPSKVGLALGFGILGLLLRYVRNKNSFVFSKQRLLFFSLMSFPFWLLVVDFLVRGGLQSDIHIKYMEHSLIVLIFPIFLAFLKIDRVDDELNRLFKVFVYTISSYTVLCLFYLFINDIPVNRDTLSNIPVIGKHSIYTGLFALIALIILSTSNLKIKHKVIHGLILIVLLVISNAKSSFLAFVVLSPFIFFKILSFKKILIVYLSFFFVGWVSVEYIPTIKERKQEFITNIDKVPEGRSYASTSIRNGLYRCAYLIYKENSIFGVSVSMLQHEMDICCNREYQSEVFEKNSFGTHSQIFDYLLSYGLIGLILLSIRWFYFLFIGYKNKDRLFVILIIGFGIVGFFETILSRIAALSLVVVFINLMVLKYYQSVFKQ